ncbi:MAG TPA: ABC transporter permease [Acidobacteriaceae bacterium]|nr:ABC transporter permease [Acidobacteriaceae bacterium]
MSLGSRIATWWRAVSERDEVDRQVKEEFEFHIESYVEDLMRSGVPREQALRQARAELGSLAAGREKCRAAWGSRLMDELWADLRYALRMLGRSPGFAAIAVGSLALGIGVNTVIFTAAQHMLLDRLAVPHPEQLRLLWWTEPHLGVVESMWGWFDDLPGGGQTSTSFSYPVYQQLRKQSSAMESLFAFKPLDRQTVTVDGHPEAVEAEMVSGNYYSSLGVRPQLGRGIQESDDGSPGSGPVVVISDRFWMKEFARSANVIGKTILVNVTPMTIVGVNPRGFTGAYSAQGTPDIFLPFSMQPIVVPGNFTGSASSSLLTNIDEWWVLVMGRMKPGLSDRTAVASLNVLLDAAVRATMPMNRDSQIPKLLMTDGSRGQNPAAEGLAKPISVLLGLGGFVLLLACANLANLLLARASARRREMSVRLALGAGRWRILRQMMTESLLLSLLGGIAGLMLAYAVRNAIPRMMSDSWAPPAFSARFDWRIFGFAAGVSIVTGLIFGLAPAWEATRVQVSSGLKDSAQTASHRRRGLAGKTIVVIEVALSMLLVVGAGLFVQTLIQLEHARLGFRPDNLLLFELQPPQTRYRDAANIPLYRQLEQKLSAIPGIQSVALTGLPLIDGNVMIHTFISEGQQRKPEGNPVVLSNDVGESFFSTYRIPIVAGRGFNASDTETSRKVAVVNESLAKKYFPRLNPIGRTFETGFHEPVRIEIVGVCGDAKYDRVRKDPEPTYYAPYWQNKHGVQQATFALATRLDAKTLAPTLRQAVQSVDRNLPVLDVRTQDEQIAASMQHERVFANLTAAFGALALILACIGIYGIMAWTVSRRTLEIGIRIAVGAPSEQVQAMVLREAAWMTSLGVAAGVGGALALGRVVASLLYGLKAWDPATFAGSATMLILVALGASWIPARRAAGVDPIRALRHE